jgi:hypothetical protein
VDVGLSIGFFVNKTIRWSLVSLTLKWA